MKINSTDARKWIVTLLELLLIIAIIIAIVAGYKSLGFAEEAYAKAYILCQPGDYINARYSASRKSEAVGRLESGDVIWLDGKTKNGYAHYVDCHFETCDCWVYTGYIVFDEPVWKGGQKAVVASSGRLAARKNCTGDVRKWLKSGSEVQVFWWSDEWCVTNYGFVKTEYLELVGE